MSRQFRQSSCLLCVLLFSAIVAPKNAHAHGELLIRIAAATSEIEAATNHFGELYLKRGELYREDQNWTGAASDYDRAEQLDPILPVRFYRAKMLDDSGQLEPSLSLFTKILKRDPRNGEALIGRARVFVKLGDSELAIVDFRNGLSALPSPRPEYFLELARTLAADKNSSEALGALDQGIERLGNLTTLQSYALELELEQKDYPSALDRLDTIIKDAPRKENWLARRGDILLQTGQPVEARKSYVAALDAVKLLPKILQKAPPLQKLQSHIHVALVGIKNAPERAEADVLQNAKNEN